MSARWRACGTRVAGAFVTAVRTLTVVPMPGREAETYSDALYWFPFVGLLVGAVAAGLARSVGLLAEPDWAGGAALLALLALSALPGGLHLDGLADWADAVGSRASRDKALAIMKDPRVGALGVAVLALVLLEKWVALTRLAEHGWLGAVALAPVLSRAAQVEIAASLPYSRAEGGTGQAFGEGAGPLHRLVALAFSAVRARALVGGPGIVLVCVCWVVCRVFARPCRRRFGGYTGDLIGACGELVETTALLLAALVAR